MRWVNSGKPAEEQWGNVITVARATEGLQTNINEVNETVVCFEGFLLAGYDNSYGQTADATACGVDGRD